VSTFLYTAITIGEPFARLNPGNGRPFAAVDLDPVTHASITVHTPAEARALADAFEAAAVMLEAQTGTGMTP
jgi:hypothetical protein